MFFALLYDCKRDYACYVIASLVLTAESHYLQGNADGLGPR